MTGEIVVCKVYKLIQVNKEFTKEFKTKTRNRAVITRDYYEQKNANWQSTGMLYELDEAATKKYYEDSEIQRKARKDAKEFEKNAAMNLANAVKGIATASISNTPAPKVEEKPKEEVAEVIDETEGGEDAPEAPTMDWSKSKMINWIESHEDHPEFNPASNKSDLMQGPIAELLTKSVK